MMKEFPNKTWKHRATDQLIKKTDMEGTTARKPEWGKLSQRFTDRASGIAGSSVSSSSKEDIEHII